MFISNNTTVSDTDDGDDDDDDSVPWNRWKNRALDRIRPQSDRRRRADSGWADKGCQINIPTTNRIEARAFGMLWWYRLYFLWGFRGVFGIVWILHTYRGIFIQSDFIYSRGCY